MKLAHVLDGRIVAFYDEATPPHSFKGKLLPIFDTERPADKTGIQWSKRYEPFEDRVEVKWIEEVLSPEQQEFIDNVAETARIRTIMEALRTGQGTAAERLARLERVVGHLCKLTLQA